MSPDAIDSAFRQATSLHQQGKLKQAESLYRHVMVAQPNNVYCLQQYGMLLATSGKIAEAVRLIERSCQLKSDLPAFWNNLGEVYRQADRLVDARHALTKALQLNQRMPEAHYNLANVLKQMGRFGEAITHYNLALVYNPKYDRALFNLANTLREEGRAVSAEEMYRKALEINPNWSDCHLNLANALYDQRKLDEAISVYRKASELKKGDPAIDESVGNCLMALGRTDEAQACYLQANAKTPERWLRQLRAEALAPPVPPSSEWIDEYRAKLNQLMDATVGTPNLDDLHSSGAEPPMALAYHGRADRALRERYSALFAKHIPATPPVVSKKGPPRIGVVVTNGHEGVFARCLGELVARLDSTKLSVTVITSRAGANVLQMLMPKAKLQGLIIPDRVDQAATLLRQVGFDLLLYWEVGTDSMNYFLPLYRPAPIQATCWGWPVTSGHQAMDYFVSWDALETDDEHYTEKLVRLTRPPTYYLRPPVPATPRGKAAFGFDASAKLYLCQQNVRKYHPEFDAVLGEILRLDPTGVIAAVADEQQVITKQLTDRWQRTIHDVAHRIKMLDRLDRGDYLELCASADVILDTPYYGGGANTVLDAVAAGTPIVTWAGPEHRGRWASAINRRLGLNEWIAPTLGDYAKVATTRMADDALRQRLRSAELFEDDEAVREWERWFETVLS